MKRFRSSRLNGVRSWAAVITLEILQWKIGDKSRSRNKTKNTRKKSEPAYLRQGHVVRQVTAPSLVWRRFRLCPIESNGNENFKVIQNPGFLPDHFQNWVTGSLCHSRHTLKISERFVHNFLSYLAHTQTDRETERRTKSGKNITSLAEAIMMTVK